MTDVDVQSRQCVAAVGVVQARVAAGVFSSELDHHS